MPENNELDTTGIDSNYPNPAIIIGIFIAIGSFVLLTSTLNSIFSIFSWSARRVYLFFRRDRALMIDRNQSI